MNSVKYGIFLLFEDANASTENDPCLFIFFNSLSTFNSHIKKNFLTHRSQDKHRSTLDLECGTWNLHKIETQEQVLF